MDFAEALRDAVMTYEQRAAELAETLMTFTCLIPPARARPPAIWCSHPPPEVALRAQRNAAVVSTELTGLPRAAAEVPHAVERVDPAAAVLSRPAAGAVRLREAAGAGHSAEAAAQGGAPRAHLHADDAHARRARELPQPPRLPVRAAGRLDQAGDAAGAHAAVQQQQEDFRLHPEHALRGGGHEPDGRGHRRLLRQRLEPGDGPAGAGPLPPHRADARGAHLPPGE
eukprot:18033-Pyramimonas_sp.AAC.1